MPAQASRRSRTSPPDAPAAAPAHHNEVHVVGRVAAAPDERILPSGDRIVVWRLVVEHGGTPMPGRPHLDTIECAAWAARLQRTALGWQAGDTVEVRGSLRRRFWRAGAAVNSRYEVEPRQARRLARASAER